MQKSKGTMKGLPIGYGKTNHVVFQGPITITASASLPVSVHRLRDCVLAIETMPF